MRIIKFFSYILFCFELGAQTSILDSLNRQLCIEKVDTNKVKLLNKIASEYLYINTDTALLYHQKALDISERKNWQKGVAKTYYLIGDLYWKISDFPKALVNDFKALKKCDELLSKNKEDPGYLNMKSATMGNIGLVYSDQGNYPKALIFFLNAMKLGEKLGNKKRVLIQYLNIGNLYNLKQDYSKAIDYYSKGVGLSKSINEKNIEAILLGNIGNVYFNQKNYLKALDLYKVAVKANREIENEEGVALNLIAIGNVYLMKMETELIRNNKDSLSNLSLRYHLDALEINKRNNNRRLLAVSYGSLGSLYLFQGKYSIAKKYLDEALIISTEIGDLNYAKDWHKDLSDFYYETNNWKLSLYHYKSFISIRDSLLNEESNRKTFQTQLEYDLGKKMTADSIRKASFIKQENLKHEHDIKQQKIYTVMGTIGFVLMLVVAGISLRAYKQKQRSSVIIESQKLEVENQKHFIEEKQKEIVDSITYAKRLQEAILPPFSLIHQEFPNSFVLYKPKDIVAGDFYWFEKVGVLKLIAAADCTGHGVPGALVSVVCSNALNRAVKEFKLTVPGEILDKVTELVLETFEKSESIIKDGMDISLCLFNSATNEIMWAGANNPLWYVANGEIKEITANKQPIGIHENRTKFTTHVLNLQAGDFIFLFTDGYADQFGGPKGKKFKYKQLENIILTNYSKTPQDQRSILETAIDSWKGDLEQIDDITIIGIGI